MSNNAGAAVAKPQIQSLQVFRGLAALAVVAHHATLSTGAFVAVMPAWAVSLFGLGLALIIVGFAMREQSSRLYWPRLFLLMGKARYSIYLVHNPLLSVTQCLAGRLNLAWGAVVRRGLLGISRLWILLGYRTTYATIFPKIFKE